MFDPAAVAGGPKSKTKKAAQEAEETGEPAASGQEQEGEGSGEEEEQQSRSEYEEFRGTEDAFEEKDAQPIRTHKTVAGRAHEKAEDTDDEEAAAELTTSTMTKEMFARVFSEHSSTQDICLMIDLRLLE